VLVRILRPHFLRWVSILPKNCAAHGGHDDIAHWHGVICNIGRDGRVCNLIAEVAERHHSEIVPISVAEIALVSRPAAHPRPVSVAEIALVSRPAAHPRPVSVAEIALISRPAAHRGHIIISVPTATASVTKVSLGSSTCRMTILHQVEIYGTGNG